MPLKRGRMLAQVFISHISEEVPLATILKTWVESAFLDQVRVFVSCHDIISGEQWFQRLEDELSNASVLLVLCSSKSVSMPWINFETGAGHIKGIPVIPVCHSGMDIEMLPKPLVFFQGLVAEDKEFPLRLMKSLAAHLGFPREPRIPYEEMATDVQHSLIALQERGGTSDSGEDSGYLDHLVQLTERIGSLTGLLTSLGTETNAMAADMKTFTNQASAAMSGQTQGTPRYVLNLAKKFGKKLNGYAIQLEALNQEYESVLPDIGESAQYVIEFQSPQEPADWESADELSITLDEVEANISLLKDNVVFARDALNQLPNIQSDIRKANRHITKQYDRLIGNLDDNIELFRRIKATLELLKNRRVS